MNAFVSSRKEEWKELKDLLQKLSLRPRALTPEDLQRVMTLYLKTAQDLAHARLYFPGTDIELFLNHLMAEAYRLVYKPPPVQRKILSQFFLRGFPSLIRTYALFFLVAFSLFTFSGAASFFACALNREAQQAFFPERFLKSIEKKSKTKGRRDAPREGNPLPDMLKPVVSSAIMTNNIQVAFIAFSTGILFCLGTIYILIENGLLIGALAYLFHREGEALYFWSMILPHGILELFSIFVSGAAGLLLGYALLVPGDCTRGEALQRAARDAVKLIMGIIPLLAVAAIIESFITPESVAPGTKLLFACLTAAALAIYLFLPRRRQNEEKRDGSELSLRF